MKNKLIAFILFCSCFQFSFAQSIMFSAGGSYGTNIEQFAPNVRLYYGLNEHICFGPEYTYYHMKNNDTEKSALDEVGFVVHYIFEIGESIGAYPVVGINYSLEKEYHHNTLEHQKNAFGTSVGAGIHGKIKHFMPFAEYKYITGQLSQHTFSVGIIYNMHRHTKVE